MQLRAVLALSRPPCGESATGSRWPDGVLKLRVRGPPTVPSRGAACRARTFLVSYRKAREGRREAKQSPEIEREVRRFQVICKHDLGEWFPKIMSGSSFLGATVAAFTPPRADSGRLTGLAGRAPHPQTLTASFSLKTSSPCVCCQKFGKILAELPSEPNVVVFSWPTFS